MKRAKIPYQTKTDKPKTGTFYKLNKIIKDNYDSSFDLYCRNKIDYYVDIPIGENQIGIIYKGYFLKCFDAHPDTLDFSTRLKRMNEVIKENNYSIKDQSMKIINKAIK